MATIFVTEFFKIFGYLDFDAYIHNRKLRFYMDNYNDTSSTSNKLDEIKKIIFGEEIRTYNGEIENLRKTIENYRTEISVKIDEVKLELLKSIESVESRLLDKVFAAQNALRQDLEQHRRNAVNKNTLGNIFEDISKTLAQ